MEQFSYNFIITMMHSVWQAALLLVAYLVIIFVGSASSPLFKRNLLFILTGVQLLVSVFTFIMVADNAPSIGLLDDLSLSLSNSLNGSWLQTNARFLLAAYFIIVIIRLSNSFYLWQRFKTRYKVSLSKPSIDLRLFTQTKAYHFGISKKVMLYCSNAITTPMTFGFWKPVILLPVALVNQLSMQETEALILHELTHIRQHDYLLNWLLVLSETLFFFNPFIHIIAQKIRTEREKNCDVQVLMFNYGEILYAETLLKTAQAEQAQLSVQLAAVKNKNQLLKRIHFFSNKKNLEFKRNRSVVPVIGLFTALMLNIGSATLLVHKKPIRSNTLPIEVLGIQAAAGSEKVDTVFTQPLLQREQISSQEKTGSLTGITDETLPIRKKETVMFVPDQVLVDMDDPAFYAIPAVNEEEARLEGKEIIVEDESSDGKKTTAVYRAILVNGIWTLQPVWMLSETKPSVADSLKNSSKDSVIRIYPAVQ